MPVRRSTSLLFAIVPLLTAAAPPLSPSAAVAARQAGYKKMGAAMKALKDELKADAPAIGVIQAASRTIALTARQQPPLFPVGSGPGSGLKTDALPAIWTNRATFDARMSGMIAETGKMVTVATSGDLAAIRAQAKVTGETCSACHRPFRADT